MQPKVSESISLANFSSRPPVCPFGCAALFVWTQCSKRAGSCYFIFSVLVVCTALAYPFSWSLPTGLPFSLVLPATTSCVAELLVGA